MTVVFDQAYKKIVLLLPAAQAAAARPHNYVNRRELARVLAAVSMDDILDVSHDPAVGTQYFKACQALVAARNTALLMAAAETLRSLKSVRWRRSQSRGRKVRPRADLHA